MIVLGVDPGTATTGYGVIKVKNAKSLEWLDHGFIKTLPGVEMPKRLFTIRKEMRKIIREYQPESLVIERLFFNTNQKTAISVGQARGVVMLCAAEYKLDLHEYTALQAKLILTGYGRSDKKIVQKAVQKLLKLKDPVKPDDAADALAVAICHVHKINKFVV